MSEVVAEKVGKTQSGTAAEIPVDVKGVEAQPGAAEIRPEPKNAGEIGAAPAVEIEADAGGEEIGIRALAKMPADTILDLAQTAAVFGKCPMSIKRAVWRGELPKPIKLFRRQVFYAGHILEHLRHRLNEAAAKAEKERRRLAQVTP